MTIILKTIRIHQNTEAFELLIKRLVRLSDGRRLGGALSSLSLP